LGLVSNRMWGLYDTYDDMISWKGKKLYPWDKYNHAFEKKEAMSAAAVRQNQMMESAIQSTASTPLMLSRQGSDLSDFGSSATLDTKLVFGRDEEDSPDDEEYDDR